MNKDAILLDAQPSMRHKDSNGYLHIAVTPISKACVNPYLGSEIAGSDKQGWKPDKIYYGLRDPDELAKAAKTFNGLPVLLEHHEIDAENPAKEWVVGSVGTDATFDKPYLKNSMTITDAQAIGYIEDGTAAEISCSYRFKPDFTSGEFTEADGSKVHYDFVMRDIEGNHVALVPEGRAGHDVRVADSNEKIIERRTYMPIDEFVEKFVEKFMPLASDEEKAAARAFCEALKPGEDADPAFAEGVKEGEKLEKEEPLKLDKEHESEGEKKVLEEDGCGKDEELPVDEANLDELLKDPKMKAVFEMGVKYGEKKEKEEPEKLDSEHESEGMEKALGEDSVAKIKSEIMEKFKALNAAAIKVRPIVGEINDPLAFDSAANVYKFALEKDGVSVDKYVPAAYEGMVDIMLSQKPSFALAHDTVIGDADKELDGTFAALKKIR